MSSEKEQIFLYLVQQYQEDKKKLNISRKRLSLIPVERNSNEKNNIRRVHGDFTGGFFFHRV
jgi:hypothetical protein